jgi:PAS domain S-box-containing protein
MEGEIETIHYEANGLKKNGEIIRIEIFCSGNLEEKTRTIMGTLLDITERTQAEDKLRQSENLLAEAEQIAQIGSWSLDLGSNIVTWSDEVYRIFGVKKSEFDHRLESVFAFIHPEDSDFVKRIVEEAVKTREPYNFYFRLVRPDGEVRIIHARGTVMADEQGNAVRMYGASQDVTDSKMAENALRQSYQEIRRLTEHLQKIREEERTRIAREIHDELGQQLTVIKMDVSWLNKKIDDTNPAVKQRLTDLLEMLNTSVQSVRKISYELRPNLLDLGLDVTIERQLKEFEKRSGIKTCFSKMEDPLELDEPTKTSLFRILQESLTNIARYSQASDVRVNLIKESAQIILRITDNGKGFDMNKVAEKKTLGLLGMKERASMMGGTFSIASEPGRGTAITVTIPAEEKNEQL